MSVKYLNTKFKTIKKPKKKKVVSGTKKDKQRAEKYSLNAKDLDKFLDESGTPREGAEDLSGEVTKRPRSTAEAMEYRHKQILRLVLRGVPKQTIANHLGMTIRQVYEDMVNINADMRKDLANLDYQGYIAMSIAFYDECRNISLRLATDTNEKSNAIKMMAIKTALQSEDSKHAFLSKVGLHKVSPPTDPFNSINTGRYDHISDESDIEFILHSIAEERDALKKLPFESE